jgi:hypothetical protein
MNPEQIIMANSTMGLPFVRNQMQKENYYFK